MDRWFCNRCKSLNARGAKRCYACGARPDYLGLDTAVATPVPPDAASSQAPTGAAAPVVHAPDADVLDFSHGSRPSARRRNHAAIIIGGAVLVAVIFVVALVGTGHGPDNGSHSGATRTPHASVATIRPSAGPSASTTARPAPTSGGGGAMPGVMAGP